MPTHWRTHGIFSNKLPQRTEERSNISKRKHMNESSVCSIFGKPASALKLGETAIKQIVGGRLGAMWTSTWGERRRMAGDARERRRRERRYLRRRTDRAATKRSQAQDVVVSRPLDLRISWPRSLPLAMRPPSSSGTRKREVSRRPWRWHRKPWLWAANGAGVDGGRAEGRRRCRMGATGAGWQTTRGRGDELSTERVRERSRRSGFTA
jgi:hypothetical protein